MLIKFIKDASADGVQYKRGADVEIDCRIANKLIDRGFAEAWSEAVSGDVEPDRGADDGDTIYG